jgi:hypothetical protein
MANNQTLTNVIFSGRGLLIGPTQRAVLTMILPTARITRVNSGDDDVGATITVNLLGFFDAVYGCSATVECVNTIYRQLFDNL